MNIVPKAEKLRSLIKESDKILITSHASPDPDSITSVLLLGATLLCNFSDKKIVMSSEDAAENLSWLSSYDKIEILPLNQSVSMHHPDLIILVDAMNFGRATKGDEAQTVKQIRNRGIKVAIIDHHEPDGKYPADVYINSRSPATVQEVYWTCFEELNLKKPEDYAETTMTGLYADTGGFVYLTDNYRQTLSIIGDLVEAGINIEEIKSHLETFQADEIVAISEFAANISLANEYSYSYLADGFIKEWEKTKELECLHIAAQYFVNHCIRNVNGRRWGFVIYKNLLYGPSTYSASFRAVGRSRDVSAIARKLGGGGHKPAAGAKFEARNLEAALEMVKSAIKG